MEETQEVYLVVMVFPEEPNNRVDGTLVALDVVALVRLQRFATDDAWYFEIATTGNGGNNSIVVIRMTSGAIWCLNFQQS